MYLIDQTFVLEVLQVFVFSVTFITVIKLFSTLTALILVHENKLKNSNAESITSFSSHIRARYLVYINVFNVPFRA